MLGMKVTQNPPPPQTPHNLPPMQPSSGGCRSGPTLPVRFIRQRESNWPGSPNGDLNLDFPAPLAALPIFSGRKFPQAPHQWRGGGGPVARGTASLALPPALASVSLQKILGAGQGTGRWCWGSDLWTWPWGGESARSTTALWPALEQLHHTRMTIL